MADHDFEPSHTGMVCERTVMRDGGGDQCGLPAEAHRRADQDADNLVGWFQDMYQESEQKVRVLEKRIEVALRHAKRARDSDSLTEFWKHWKLVMKTLDAK